MEPLEERTLLAVQPFPVPLDPAEPLGSQLFDRGHVDRFDATSETDGFTIEVDSGQSLAVVLSPDDASLEARLELFGPDSASLGWAAAPAAGLPVWLQAVPITAAGVYQLDLTSLAGSGDYEVTVVLNAVVEEEGLGGVANDSIATAEELGASHVDLQGSADRLAAIGETEGGDDFFSFDLGAGQSVDLVLRAADGGDLALELQDSAGATLARGIEVAGDAEQRITGFVAPLAQTYYVSVSGDAGQRYSLLGTRGASFGLEGLGSVGQDITLAGQVGQVLDYLDYSDGQEQKLTADDAAATASFGISVAVDGDTALVGAYRQGTGGAAIYIGSTAPTGSSNRS